VNTGSMHPFAVKLSESELGTRKYDASVPLITYENNGWIGEISIGTPPQTLQGKFTCIMIRVSCVYSDLCHSPNRHRFSVGTLFDFTQLFLSNKHSDMWVVESGFPGHSTLGLDRWDPSLSKTSLKLNKPLSSQIQMDPW
jgi:hypothetical protein